MRKLLLFFLILLSSIANAQYSHLLGLNFTHFTEREKTDLSEIDQLISSKYFSHPDLGLFPFETQKKISMIELVDQRTIFSRYFVERGSHGKRFMIQQSYNPINFIDESGWLREIDFRLRPTSAPMIFTANQQRSPITIDIGMKEVTIICKGKKLSLAKELRLIHKDDNGVEVEVGKSNWSNYTVGDEGLRIINFYPDVDLIFSVRESKIETDFVIKRKLNLANGKLIMRQKFELFDNLRMTNNENFNHQLNYITDEKNNIYFSIEKCYAFSNDENSTAVALASGFNVSGEFDVLTNVDWLNSPQTKYPVVIDPIITAADSLLAASIIGTKFSPVCWTNSCDYFLSVPSPANSTIVDISTSFSFQTIATCTGMDGGFSVDYSTCTFPSAAPGVMWCPFSPGSTLCTFDSIQIPEFNSCFPAPVCAPQNLDFTLHFYRCNNDPDVNCTGNCVRAYSPWVMYISGRTLEQTFFTPSMQICGGTNVDLVVVPEYGVPPYAFVWNTTPINNDTITVSPNVTTIYNVNVTDACGNNFVATDTISVEPNDNPGFVVNPTTACINQNISLAGNGGAVVTNYDWVVPGSNAPGGVINDNQNPTIQYTVPGTYNITLRYFNANCLYFDSTIAITITSQSVPDVALSTTIAGPYCQGDTLHFSANPTNGGTTPTYDWIVDGVVLQSSAVDTFSTSTLINGSVVQVVLHSNSNCVTSPTDTASTFIALNSSVTPQVTISPDTAICPGSPVTFTANSNNGGNTPTYQWFVNGVSIGGANSTTFNTTLNATDTIISVTMNSSVRCVITSTATDTSMVIQLANISPTLALASDASSVSCEGDTVHFLAASEFGGASPLFQWYVNGIPSGGATSDSTFTHILANGTDSISVKITSSYACLTNAIAVDHQIVEGLIALAPTVTISTMPSVVCEGKPLTFIAQPHYGGVNPTFEWFVNGNSVGNGSSVSPGILSNKDSVSVEMVSSAPCAITPMVSNSFLINNLPAPIADYTYFNPYEGAFLNQISFLNTSIDASSWIWYFRSDSDSSFARNPVHEFPGQGTYEVTLMVTNNNGCIDSITYNVLVTEEIAVFLPKAFTPNGDDINEFFEPIGASLTEYEFRIYNRWGEVVFIGNEKKPWNGNVKDSAVPAPEGVYVYHLEAKGLDLDKSVINGRVTLIR